MEIAVAHHVAKSNSILGDNDQIDRSFRQQNREHRRRRTRSGKSKHEKQRVEDQNSREVSDRNLVEGVEQKIDDHDAIKQNQNDENAAYKTCLLRNLAAAQRNQHNSRQASRGEDRR
ncbi:MAG: hypothetical protein WAK54_08285 [Bradyrhizobium sp.]